MTPARPTAHGCLLAAARRYLPLAASLLLAAVPALADSVRVKVNGLDSELEQNVRAKLSLVALAERDDLTELAVRRLHRRAPQQVVEALQPFGYYEPQVQRTLSRRDDGTWLATYTIEPGPVVTIADVTVSATGPGRNNAKLLFAIANNALETDAPLRHRRYERLKSAMRRAALEEGYLDASFTTHVMRVDPTARRADIELVLETGPRFMFGEVTIEQDALADSLVRRYLDIEPGTPFDQTRLLDAQYALQDSGFYSSVEVRAERERAENYRVPVRLTATPRKRQRYSAGVGFTSDAGPRVTLGWENRRINDRGHRADVDLRVSEPRVEFSTRYSRPFGDPRTDRYVYSFAHRDEDLGDDTDSRRQEVAATQTRVLGEWQRNLYLQLTHEISQIAEVSSSDTLLLPGIAMTRSRTDNAVQPRRAQRWTGDLRGSHGALGADTNFLRLKLETRLVHPMGRGRILYRGDLGLSAVGDFGELPASQRFFAGGDRSVRGYGYNELGPRDADGFVIGGRYLFAGSVELEWPIVGRWSTAAFVDAGNAFNDFSDFGGLLRYSVGVGARLRTPVGVVRVDVAKPVSEGDQSLRLHFGIGVDL